MIIEIYPQKLLYSFRKVARRILWPFTKLQSEETQFVFWPFRDLHEDGELSTTEGSETPKGVEGEFSFGTEQKK